MTLKPPDYAAWRFWMDVLVLLFVGANGLYTWWSNREKVTSKRFELLEAKVKERLPAAALEAATRARDAKCTDHQLRTARIESTLGAIPTRPELVGLSHEINSLTEKLGRIEGRLEGINRVADLMNEFLINQGGKP